LGTRPDIALATNSLPCFGHNPGRVHWEAAKRVLRYLKGTRGGTALSEANRPRSRRSALDRRVHNQNWQWRCQLEANGAEVRRSLIDGGRVQGPPCQAAKKSVWMVYFLKSLGISVCDSVVINSGNQASIAFTKNPVFHDRSKHIHIQHHYTRDLVREKRISLNYIPTKEMVADLLTRASPRAQHKYLAKGIGLFEVSFSSLGSQRGGSVGICIYAENRALVICGYTDQTLVP
jgi:hypothetical protein